VSGIGAKFYGNGSMNSASLVEAADTAPFFHNNSANSIEDAVRFYTTTTFSDDDPFQLDDTQVQRLAAFLRALNALDNVRNVGVLAEDAQRQPPGRARQTIEVVIADAEDAIEVLTGGPLDLHPEAVELLDEALALAEDAHDAEEPALRNGSLRQVQEVMKDIPDLILQAEPGSEVADGDAAPPEGPGAGDGETDPPSGGSVKSGGDRSGEREEEPDLADASWPKTSRFGW
jgi:hypothetical protein